MLFGLKIVIQTYLDLSRLFLDKLQYWPLAIKIFKRNKL